ncbi:Ctr-domain-containing protein [Violaceomyces palustris]|uniref:Ctr-domain-containing protein n=1 Tax=Violaceomyces palustris TaxID=1673888 RepID=A0ACD0NV59_9BASI|nr:Ctr-domain-containing protein [Violaceomyces palustris]
MNHHGGGMDDGGGATCKISMLWNWTVQDACFLSSSWHIKNNGMFAASCIGVALLVVVLEGLRRLSKEYDQKIHLQFQEHALRQSRALLSSRSAEEEGSGGGSVNPGGDGLTLTFRYSPLQQLLRATLHAVTFGVAYIIMLLAMYFNGYIIISIIIGSGIGKFLCDWSLVKVRVGNPGSKPEATSAPKTTIGGSTMDEPTICCG